MDPLLGKYDPICYTVWPKLKKKFFFLKVRIFTFILIKYMSVLRLRFCFIFFSTFERDTFLGKNRSGIPWCSLVDILNYRIGILPLKL